MSKAWQTSNACEPSRPLLLQISPNKARCRMSNFSQLRPSDCSEFERRFEPACNVTMSDDSANSRFSPSTQRNRMMHRMRGMPVVAGA
jgi:hypothetical protein